MPLLRADKSIVMAIDVQQKLLPAMADHEQLLKQIQCFIEGAQLCSVPVIATEHWPDKIGATHPDLLPHIDTVIGKTNFNAAREEAVINALAKERPQVLLTGIEAHICVLQTGLSLAKAGFTPFLVVDAIASRSESSKETALSRWRHHGLETVTTEMALFEWLEHPGHPNFRSILPLVK